MMALDTRRVSPLFMTRTLGTPSDDHSPVICDPWDELARASLAMSLGALVARPSTGVSSVSLPRGTVGWMSDMCTWRAGAFRREIGVA